MDRKEGGKEEVLRKIAEVLLSFRYLVAFCNVSFELPSPSSALSAASPSDHGWFSREVFDCSTSTLRNFRSSPSHFSLFISHSRSLFGSA